MSSKEWFDYTDDDLQNTDKQKEVFCRMIRLLEDKGKCRYIFHRLAFTLFGDSFGDEDW